MSSAITIDEDSLYGRIAWRLLPLLMIGWTFNYIDRVNIGFAKLQMAQDLGFSDAVYGFGAGVFFVGYFLFEVPSNLLLRRVGARVWIGRIMLTWAVVSALTAFVRTPWQFYGMRLLLGLAEAGFIPGVLYYLSTWYPSYRRGRVFGVFYLALAGSGVVGGPLAGLVLKTLSGALGIAGWKWLLMVEGVPSLIIGFLILGFLPSRVENADWLSETERRHVQDAVAAEDAQKAPARLSSIFTDPVVWLLIAIYFLLNYAGLGLSFWIPTLIRDLGVRDNLDIGLIAALPSLCAMVAMILFGRSADRRRERRWHLTAIFLIGTAGFILSVAAEGNAVLSIVGLCLATVCTVGGIPLFWAVPTAKLEGVTAAAGIAMINALGSFAGFFGPYAIGVMRETFGGNGAAVISLAGVLALCAVLIHLVPSALIDRQPTSAGSAGSAGAPGWAAR